MLGTTSSLILTLTEVAQAVLRGNIGCRKAQ